MSRLGRIFNHPKAAPRSEAGSARCRIRAVDSDEKEARRQAILDAAEKLFAAHQDMANVADVADAAGLAKGTVYLYFHSKEEVYLALHLRYAGRFLGELAARLSSAQTFGFAEVRSLAIKHILDEPNYLPLSACCVGFAAGAVSAAASAYFEARLGALLQAAGDGLERHFPQLEQGEGARLLRHSYAFMLGLYCLLRRSGPSCAPVDDTESFQEEATHVLARYWAQVAGIDDSATGISPGRGK